MTASNLSISLWRTRLEIIIWRYGWIWPSILVLAILVLVLKFAWLPQQQRALKDSQIGLISAQQRFSKIGNTQLPTLEPITNAQIEWNSLDAYTVSDVELSTVVRRVTVLAKKQGLLLTQSEFLSSTDGHGGLKQVQITLPIRASYPQVRAFIESALRELPMVSVDQVSIKRDTVAQALVEVRLKLSVWVNPNGNKISNLQPSAIENMRGKQL